MAQTRLMSSGSLTLRWHVQCPVLHVSCHDHIVFIIAIIWCNSLVNNIIVLLVVVNDFPDFPGMWNKCIKCIAQYYKQNVMKFVLASTLTLSSGIVLGCPSLTQRHFRNQRLQLKENTLRAEGFTVYLSRTLAVFFCNGPSSF